MDEVRILIGWVRARVDLQVNHRNESGFAAVEWLLIALGVITIAAIAVAAVKSYVTSQTNKLGTP